MSTEKLQALVTSVDGMKKIAPKVFGLFGGGKKLWADWNAADIKAVVRNRVVAEFHHPDNDYQIMAFSLNGEVPDEMVAALHATLRECPLGTVRYEATMRGADAYLSPLPFDDERINKIVGFSKPDEGLFVYPICPDKGMQLEHTLYARKGDEHLVYAVDSRRLR